MHAEIVLTHGIFFTTLVSVSYFLVENEEILTHVFRREEVIASAYYSGKHIQVQTVAEVAVITLTVVGIPLIICFIIGGWIAPVKAHAARGLIVVSVGVLVKTQENKTALRFRP